jgi:hypothetical protein
MFRSEEGWVQVDYGTGNIPIPRSKYEENKYKPDFDKLPSEAEYLATEKKDGAPRPQKAKSVPHDNGAMPVMVTVLRRRAATPSSDRSRGAGGAGYIYRCPTRPSGISQPLPTAA